MNTNDPSFSQPNVYAAPRSRLTNETGTSFEWEEFSRHCVEKIARRRVLAGIATYFAYSVVNGALFFLAQALFGDGTIIQLHSVGLLIMVMGYVAASVLGVFLLAKLTVFSHFRAQNIEKFVGMAEKDRKGVFWRPAVVTLFFVFIGFTLNLSAFQLLAVDFTLFSPLASFAAFPVVFFLCYPLWRAVIRMNIRLLETMNPSMQERSVAGAST